MYSRVMSAFPLARRKVLLGSAVLWGSLGAWPRPLRAANVDNPSERTSMTLNARTCALVLIDLQRSNAGSPFAPRSFVDVVSNGNALAVAVRRGGGLVARTHVLDAEIEHPTVDDASPVPPPVPGGEDFAVDAGPLPGDVVITKRQWGAFYGTDLDQQLKRRSIGTLLIAGVATEVGVESTARAAFDRGYRLVFVNDAIAGATVDSHRFFMDTLFPRMGQVRSSAEIAASFSPA